MANPLDQELLHLLETHPQIKSQIKAVESARKGVDAVLADYMPTVNVTADMGPEHIDNPTTRSSRDGGKDWNRVRNVAGFTVTQNLFDGFATSAAVQSARMSVAVADFTLDGTVQNTLFEGVNAYIGVLRQKRLIELASGNEDNISTQLNLEDSRVSRGSGVAVDVLQAKSRLQIAKERRISFEGALNKAVATYIQAFDHAPNLDLLTDPPPPVELIPETLDEVLEIALEENPAITNSQATIEVARIARKTVEAEYFPTIDLVGAMNYEKHNNATLGTRRDYSLLVELSWDLFTGFSTKATAAQAAYDYRAAMDNHEYIARKVQEQTRIAWEDLLTARRRLELLENAVNIATEVFDSRKKLREAGKETVINVLDAENEIYNAQINYTSASYDERVAIFQLLLSMGRLNAAALEVN